MGACLGVTDVSLQLSPVLAPGPPHPREPRNGLPLPTTSCPLTHPHRPRGSMGQQPRWHWEEERGDLGLDLTSWSQDVSGPQASG